MKNNWKKYILAIVVVMISILVLLGLIINAFYTNVREKALDLGEARLYQEKEQMTYYMSRAIDSVQMTTIQVEYMMNHDADNEEILEYLTSESERYAKRIDENFTGIYGWINGEYLDGIGWAPDDDYVATERIWYKKALAAGGETTIVSPYIDAQTGKIMVSVCQLLQDGKSVISLDIQLDTIQEMAEEAAFDGIGYGFVCDREGLVLAHSDATERGKNYHDEMIYKELMQQISTDKSTRFELELSGVKTTVFSVEILDGWYVVMVVTNKILYQDLYSLINRSIWLCLIIMIAVGLYMYSFIMKEQQLRNKLYESRENLKSQSIATLTALTRAIEAKDRYTRGHSARVAKYSRMIATRMGKSEEEIESIYNTALLHDVGKLRVPGKIINKAGKLTDEEFEFIKLHPVAGYNILKSIPGEKQLPIGAKFHHERYDGSGYPNGLSGENIPELARIIAVADSYDAMASNRSYRKALPQQVVRSEIEKGMGTQFDPNIAKIMMQIIDEDKEYELSEKERSDRTILIVDDSKINMIVAENILKTDPRYHILKAASGEAAIEMASKNAIDLVLLDIEMPGMDGFETLEKLRKIVNAPVIFMTADKDLSTINKAAEMGVEDYITKPFSHPILLESVYGALH